MALVVWLMFGLVAGRIGGTNDGSPLDPYESSPLDPYESWRQDRASGLASGLMFGLVFGLVFGLAWGIAAGIHPNIVIGPVRAFMVGLVSGPGCWLILALAFWLGISRTWQAILAWLQLQCVRQVPGVALMPFLKDAQVRGILRTVGSAYQFRHCPELVSA